MTVRKASILALLAALSIPGYALTVGIAPAEAKDRAPPPEGLGSPMSYLVSGCLGVLFEAGHIATEASVSRVARESWGPADYGLAEAREGRVDYLIAIYVEWSQSSIHKDAALPASIAYRLVRVRDGRILSESSLGGPGDSEGTSTHEARTASQAGASVARPIVQLLSTLAMGGE
jgi:hypothetical protein